MFQRDAKLRIENVKQKCLGEDYQGTKEVLTNSIVPHSDSLKLERPHSESREREQRDDAKLRIESLKQFEFDFEFEFETPPGGLPGNKGGSGKQHCCDIVVTWPVSGD